MALTYDYITTTTMGSDASSLTISSIPSTHTDLIVTYTLRAPSNFDTFVYLRYNGLTFNNYSTQYFLSNGGSTFGTIYTSQTEWRLGVTQQSSGTPGWCVGQLDIQNYANNSGTSQRQIMFVQGSPAETADGSDIYMGAGVYSVGTAALTSLTFFLAGGANLQAGTQVTIWGVLRA